MTHPKRAPHSSAGVWVLAAAGVISAMLVYTGFTSGDWRGVVVTEVQVLVVSAVTWIGIR